MRKLLLIVATFAMLCFRSGVADDNTARGIVPSYPTIDKAFIAFHDKQLQLLDVDTRAVMVYFATEMDSLIDVPTQLGGMARIEKLTPDYIKVGVTEVSTFEMRTLPTKKDSIFVTVHTVRGQAADSRIDFYDKYMAKIDDKKLFAEPKLKDFFDIPRGSLTKMSEIEQMVGFTTIEYSLNDEDNTLRARLTVDKHMNQDDYNIVRLFLRDSIFYDWDGKRYRLRKEK